MVESDQNKNKTRLNESVLQDERDILMTYHTTPGPMGSHKAYYRHKSGFPGFVVDFDGSDGRRSCRQSGVHDRDPVAVPGFLHLSARLAIEGNVLVGSSTIWGLWR